jgi:hypothetical protein
MNSLVIDIEGTPPTVEDLAQARREATETRQHLEVEAKAFQRRFYRVTEMLGFLLILVMCGLILNGNLVMAVVVATALVAAMFGGLASFIPLSVAVAVVVSVDMAGRALGVSSELQLYCIDLAGVLAGALAGPFVCYWIVKIVTLKVQQIDVADQYLSSMAELNDSDYSEQCIAYKKLVASNDIIATYQHKLAAQERNPVMAEYNASCELIAAGFRATCRGEPKEMKSKPELMKKDYVDMDAFELDFYFMRVSVIHQELALVADRMGRLTTLSGGHAEGDAFDRLERHRKKLNDTLQELQADIESK